MRLDYQQMALWKEKRDRGKLPRSSRLQQKVKVTPNSKEDYREERLSD